MFQFAALARHGLYIHPCVTPSGCPVTTGFPIRRSPDQSSFDSSPGHFAAYHVLHRLSTPRHPPCTLNSLITFTKCCPLSLSGFRHLRDFPARFGPSFDRVDQAAIFQALTTSDIVANTTPNASMVLIAYPDFTRTERDVGPMSDVSTIHLSKSNLCWRSKRFEHRETLWSVSIRHPAAFATGIRPPCSAKGCSGPNFRGRFRCPNSVALEPMGLEPTTSWLQTRRSPN